MDTDYIREIHWFDAFDGWNPHAFLSNFFEGEPIVIGGYPYPTGEHAFQAYKTGDEKWFAAIASAKDAGTAKALGRRAPLRPDWELVKYDVMRLVVTHKFTLDREEGQLLLMTGDALLTEGTWWGDDVWGVCMHRTSPFTGWPGRNWLGTLLMARRAELRAMRRGAPTPRTRELLKFAEEIVDPGWARTRRVEHVRPAASTRDVLAKWVDQSGTLFSELAQVTEPEEPEELEAGGPLAFTQKETNVLLAALADYRVTLDGQKKEVPPEVDNLEEILGDHLDYLTGWPVLDEKPAERQEAPAEKEPEAPEA